MPRGVALAVSVQSLCPNSRETGVTDQRAATGPAKADLMQEDQAAWDGA